MIEPVPRRNVSLCMSLSSYLLDAIVICGVTPKVRTGSVRRTIECDPRGLALAQLFLETP
jgi:hypothetical protein